MKLSPGVAGDILFEHLQMLKQENKESFSFVGGVSGHASFSASDPTHGAFLAPHHQPYDLSAAGCNVGGDYRLFGHHQTSYLQHPVREFSPKNYASQFVCRVKSPIRSIVIRGAASPPRPRFR